MAPSTDAPPTAEATAKPDDPDDQGAPGAEPVGQAAAEEQKPGQREGVGGHHPGPRGDGHVQATLDGRQGDEHDRRVEHRHQVG